MSDEQAALAAAIREIKSRSASYGVDNPDDDYLAEHLIAVGWRPPHTPRELFDFVLRDGEWVHRLNPEWEPISSEVDHGQGCAVVCDNCGRTVPLYFNGGELDGRDCPCGERQFALEHGDIYLVKYRKRPSE